MTFDDPLGIALGGLALLNVLWIIIASTADLLTWSDDDE